MLVSNSVNLMNSIGKDARAADVKNRVGNRGGESMRSQLIINKFWEKVAKGARMPDDHFQMLKVYMGY